MTGRFAPSPTGRMHLGNIFTALLAWLSVRSQGGRMLLRIEDLDPQRSRAAYAEQLRRDLGWLGLDWDGEMPPQSTRSPVYAAHFARLEEQGLIYPCYCSRSELHDASAPHASDGTVLYSGACRDLTPEQRAAKTRRPAWRVRVPDIAVSFRDGVCGPQTRTAPPRPAAILSSDAPTACMPISFRCVRRCARQRDGGRARQRSAGLHGAAAVAVLRFRLSRTAILPCSAACCAGRTSPEQAERDLYTEALRARCTPEQLVGRLAQLVHPCSRGPEPVRAADLVSPLLMGAHSARRDRDPGKFFRTDFVFFSEKQPYCAIMKSVSKGSRTSDIERMNRMFKIVRKKELNSAVTLMEIEAPFVAKKAKAGQFIIFRVDETGERVPLTIAGYDREKGYGSHYFPEGRPDDEDARRDERGATIFRTSSVRSASPRTPRASKRVCVVGGGVGCAIALPSAQAFKEAGAEVDVIVGFRNKDIVILEDEFKACSDHLYLMTDDGSYGEHGFVTVKLQQLLEAGRRTMTRSSPSARSR